MDEILFKKKDGIGWITLNRPEKHNAYTTQMSAELSEALKECDTDDAVKCVLLTGAGESFCVGLDLNDSMKYANADFGKMTFSERLYPFQIRKPVICAINGRAGGFGIAYPIACDIRLVAEDAAIAFSFVKNGLVPEMGVSWLLPKLVGIEKAAELLFTGKKINGREAARIGLVSEALPKHKVVEKAEEMALEISRNSSACIAVTKQLLWSRLTDTKGLGAAIIDDRDYIMWAMKQEDFTEGAMAFLQKRPPVWKTPTPDKLPTKKT